VEGAARFFAERAPGGTVLVGHDTRFLGERLAESAALGLAAHGLRPVLGRGAVPTPAVTHALARSRAAGAVMFTASHNPPEYQGLKVFAERGRGVSEDEARRIESLVRPPGAAPARSAKLRHRDLRAAYAADVTALLQGGPLGRGRIRVVYDAMHGAGAGVLDAVLREAGVRVQMRRGEPDPRFGGEAPDPSRRRLRALARDLSEGRGPRLGLATDGDADRCAVLDEEGRLLSETQALALLVDHLARTGRARRGVAVSIATGSLVERVAAEHGLPVTRHPIGFKHLGRALAEGSADVAGEESGGFAWVRFGADKDGILAGCLLVEAATRARGSLRAALAALERRHGRSACGRVAVRGSDAARRRLERLLDAPPARVDGARVREASTRDGLHLDLADGFLMLRASGTEPLLRVYAEAPGAAPLARRLRAGARLLGARAVDA